MDITSVLAGWHFRPGRINVRLIRGRDGKKKIQWRLDLGLLQMEVNGRPDARRPHNMRSELDYHRQRLARHQKSVRSDQGFSLTGRECQALREESVLYYHRYLAFFALGDYDGAVGDTQHNLDVLDMCRKYGRTERDRAILEQYRPYILMIQGRARACLAIQQGFARTALAYLRGTLRRILAVCGHPAGRNSMEARILLEMIRAVRRHVPPDPKEQLHQLLLQAVAHERYEEAASLRDQILAMRTADAIDAITPLPRRAAPRRRRVGEFIRRRHTKNSLPPADTGDSSGAPREA